ncbi:hypothetical protein E3P99_02344 [Wallemia hederae]|uniref:DUF1279 domain-containing protein n=1 Tax=Wallemia hederae TaxID=1540922 RepID=A0A4T0FLC5_9BASI|nr:hypothetical protein E3P99_02344 [Wallemia hederae]
MMRNALRNLRIRTAGSNWNRCYSTQPKPPPQQSQSLAQRFKELSKKYGWVAVGVYTAISVLDFSAAFAAVNVVGAERVKVLEKKVLNWVGLQTQPSDNDGNEKEDKNSIWAMAVLAYGIHKTLFLPPRLALAAGITPRLVKELQRRGYAVGPNAEKVVARVRKVKERIDRDKH